MPTARRNAKLQTFMRRRAGLQSAPLNSTPDGLIGSKKSARLYLFKKKSNSKYQNMFSPKLLLAAHATEVFKAAASDPNANEDTEDPVRQADHNEDKLDKVENQLFSSQSLLKMG